MSNRFQGILIFFVCIITMLILVAICFFFFKLDPTFTGPIGDTFGGLFSPVIGTFSLIYIYKTFTEQRAQLNEQRGQYTINRITDIIYRQLDRVNESVKSQSFLFNNTNHEEGYRGLNSINKVMEENINFLRADNAIKNLRREDVIKTVSSVLDGNLAQLTEIHDNVSNAVEIVDNLIKDASLNSNQNNELRNLLVLNLNDSIRRNVINIISFFEVYKEKVTDFDVIWYNEYQLQMLNRLASRTKEFFEGQ